MAIGLRELRDSAARMTSVLRSPLLPIFTIVTAIEAMAVFALPGSAAEAVEAMLGNPILGIFSGPYDVLRVLGLVALIIFFDLFRTSLWSGMRRIAVEEAVLGPREIVFDALRRMLALFVTKQCIGLMVTALGLFCLLIGLTLQTFPHIIVSFTFAPAVYAVVALRRSIPHALSQAPRITRYNFFAVFGVQGAILILAIWISEFFRGSADVVPFVGSYAAMALLVGYRFADFFGVGTLFLALDEAGEFDR